MASVSEGSDSKLNVELNLVPFIDLLSSLVLFLLVTAVWLQVGTIPASVDAPGKAKFTSAEQNNLLIHVSAHGFQLTWPQKSNQKNLPNHVDFNFTKLEDILNHFPKNQFMPVAAVSSDDSVEYGVVIQTIDTAKRSGFTSVALSVD